MYTMRIFSSDIGMTFSIEKYSLMEMKREKLNNSDGINLPNDEKIKSKGAEESYL